MGLEHVITFDMGGTTAKASLIERGEVTRVHMNAGRRRHCGLTSPHEARATRWSGSRPR